MRLGTAVLAAMSLGLAATSADSLAQGTRPAPTAVWAPKPADLPGYSAPQRPWKKLADYLHETAPPAAPAGSRWIAATITRTPGRYDEFNRPHLNIHEAAAGDAKYSGGRFVRDDKSEMLVLYGHEKNLPPLDPKDKGHFHAESAEFWLVFAGQIRYAFEGQAPFVASEGDVVPAIDH